SLAPIYKVAMPSDPLMWYPPTVAFLSTSSIVMSVLLFPCGGMEEQSLILYGYLQRTVLVHERVKADRILPPLLNRLYFCQHLPDRLLVLDRLLGSGRGRLCHCLSSLSLAP